MAVAWDIATDSTRTDTSDPYSFTHSPTGVPRAVVVAAVHGDSDTDHVVAVSYGGVAMSRILRRMDTATEPGAAELWFLGEGIPAGDQTVLIDLASGTGEDIHFVCMTMTADRNCVVVDSGGLSNNQADPSVTLAYGGRTCLAVAALYGGGASPGDFTPNASCSIVRSSDLGAFYSKTIRQTTPGSSNFAIGGTAGSDDVAYVALAVSEALFVQAPRTAYRRNLGRR